jgi:hypothetical protein
MYWMLGYCAACWLLAIPFVRRVRRTIRQAFEEAGCDRAGSSFLIQLRLFAMFLLAPVAAPWLLYILVRSFFQCLAGTKAGLQEARRYRECQFIPASLGDLDDAHRASCKHLHDEFALAGFSLAAEYQNKLDPVPVYNRYYTHPAGVVIGDVTVLLNTAGAGLMSVLTDGTYVETAGCAPCKMSGEVQDKDLLVVRMAGELPVSELLRRHLQVVESESRRRSARVLRLHPHQIPEIAIYGQRRFWSWRARCGEDVGEVPEAVIPSGCQATPATPGRAGAEQAIVQALSQCAPHEWQA